eukprot:417389_1
MFIGSLPHHGVDLASKAGEDDTDDNGTSTNPTLSPPFRNPVSLQERPSTETSSINNSKSCMQQGQLQTIGVSGVLSTTTTTMMQGRSNNTADNLLLPPLTTMDGLASSPFKFP